MKTYDRLWGAPLERLRAALTPYLRLKNDAPKNQEINEKKVIDFGEPALEGLGRL